MFVSEALKASLTKVIKLYNIKDKRKFYKFYNFLSINMQVDENERKKARAFSIKNGTFSLIEQAAQEEMGGNTSKWVQAEFDKIFAAREAEKNAGK